MNVVEFGNVFVKSLYYLTISGLILAGISFVRINFTSRHSMSWYGINMVIHFLKKSEYEPSAKLMRYSDYKMTKLNFVLWQITKLVLFAPLLGSMNMVFGMVIDYAVHGNDIGLGSLGNIFVIPFADVPVDGSYAQRMVVPLFPILTLIVPPLLFVMTLRIALYIGLSGAVNIVSQYMVDTKESKPRFLSYISTTETIIGSLLFWIGFSMFFNHFSDYNTKYAIIGVFTLAAAFLVYGVIDRRHARFIIYPTKRHIYSRLLTVGIVIIVAGATMAINTSIANTKKLEWFGPYIAQEISTNRILQDLDQIHIVNYDIGQSTMPIGSSEINQTTTRNSDILNNIRLWDETNAKDKLDSALRNDITFANIEMLRFNGKLYWAGSTTPKIPDTTSPAADEWFQQHMVYTHSDMGIKMMEADNGNIVNDSKFFPQKIIYYGQSADDDGVFRKYWSAYPIGTSAENKELDRFKYNGTGGVDVSPPLSWMFDPTLMLSEPSVPIHVMRYKDIQDRMQLLHPYFIYQFGAGGTPNNPQFKDVEAYPVSDGKNTYWLMPLMIPLGTSSVPWSSNLPSSNTIKLVGYSLINAYDGNIQIIVTGNDYFSSMFYEQYKDTGATKVIPDWLANQIKYPTEMIMWRLFQFNSYHVTQPQELLDRKNSYSFTDDPSNKNGFFLPYSVFAKPQGFVKPNFLTIEPLQFLQLRDQSTKNLAGYMTVENDADNLGNMTFYSIPSNSTIKLMDPTEAQNTLEKNKDYNDLKLAYAKNQPSSGDILLYKIGNYEVYFNPLFTNAVAGPQKQIAKVVAIGAASVSGDYAVGLGDTPVNAFEDFLGKLSGMNYSSSSAEQQQQIGPPLPSTAATNANQTTGSPDITSKVQRLEKVFAGAGFTVLKPTSISTPVIFREEAVPYKTDSDIVQVNSALHNFIERFASPGDNRIYEWQQDNGSTVNFSILKQINGIIENHYISVGLR